MVEEREIQQGEIVRRNRRAACVQQITSDRVHLRILKDFNFRVFETEVVSLAKAPQLLRRLRQGHYSSILFETPDRIEDLCKADTLELMRLILCEHQTPFGKREFKQILVMDDGIVAEEDWNA
ncbi:MAG: hypothetical protein ACYTHN_10280, partial [Planctomycetota bacterium]